MIHFGKIENRQDPLKLGRVKVRIVGIHTPDKALLPTDDLPWAIPIQNSLSAAMNGIGTSPSAFVENTTVAVMFADEDKQIPLIIGSISGIPQSIENNIESLYSDVEFVEPNYEHNISSIIPDSSEGNVYLNAEMDRRGITSKYARAAIQAICNVESNNFKTLKENLNYTSPERLLVIYPSIFKNDIELARQYTNNPDALAKLVYSPNSATGKSLGNKTESDSVNYIGRGYVQITGLSNYTAIGKAINENLVTNPTLLENPVIAAKASVEYFIQRVKVSQDDPAYYQSAKKSVGNNSIDILGKKNYLYAYYLSETISQIPQTDKGQSVNIPVDTNQGFSDPNGKYPLKNYINEPDTNRLARGNFSGTIVETKENLRVTNIPLANNTGTWNQPEIPYNATYPFNQVKETESGHIFEVDDTPGNERIHEYHRMGTFKEIDCNGSMVTRVVGDNYEIIDRNGNIFINGAYNITASGLIGILSKSDLNIQVYGDANINVHGNAATSVAGTYSINALTYKVKANNVIFESNDYSLNTSEYKETITGDSHYRWEGDKYTFIGADTYNRHDSGIDYGCPSDPSRNSGTSCVSVTSANVTGLGNTVTPLTKNTRIFKPLTTPLRQADKVLIYESPDELEGSNVPTIQNLNPGLTTSEESVIQKQIQQLPSDCESFKTNIPLSNSLILHTDSTGYNWTLGKLLNGNKLKPITVKGVYYSEADIVCNLKNLAINVLSKINEMVGSVDVSWFITSCYRNYVPPGGSVTSQHLTGMAVDVSFGNLNYDTTYDWTKKFGSDILYDQMILEYLDRDKRINWVHLSYNKNGNRRQILTMLNHKVYSKNLSKLA